MKTRRGFLAACGGTGAVALAGCLNDGGGGGGSLFASVAGNPNVAADVQEISTQPDGVLSSLLHVNPSAVRSARDALPGRVTWGEFLNGFYFPPAAFSQDAVPERVVTGTYQTYVPGHTWIRAGLGVARGDVNETALRDSLEVGDEGRSTRRGYDLFEQDREDSFAIGDDVLIGAGATYFMDQDESSPATPETLKAALLRGCVDRVEDQPSPHDRVGDAVDAVDSLDVAAIVHAEDSTRQDGPPHTELHAYGLGPEEVTYQIAIAAETESDFDRLWDPESVRDALRGDPVDPRRESGDPDPVAGPNLDADGRVGVGTITLPTPAVHIVYW